MKVVAVIQARMSSTRLPGKVLRPLAGRSVLDHVVRRASRARTLAGVVVATTDRPDDLPIAQVAEAAGAGVVRGPLEDVLRRYVMAAAETGADHVVRITADCPCTDPDLIDRVVAAHLDAGADYSSNVHPRSFPHGFDLEVVSAEALHHADREAAHAEEREHVTPFIWRRAGRFSTAGIVAAPGEAAPDLRVTLDTPDDYLMLRALFDLLGENEAFGVRDVVRTAERHGWLTEINAAVRQKRLSGGNVAERRREELVETARWALDQEMFHGAAAVLDALDAGLSHQANPAPEPSAVRARLGRAEADIVPV